MISFYKTYCRLFQLAIKIGLYILPWREPQLYRGVGSIVEVAKIVKAADVSKGTKYKQNNRDNKYNGECKLLVVTDHNIVRIGLIDKLLNILKSEQIDYVIYSETEANPTIDNVEAAVIMYQANNCNALIAFGGGSPIDCAKAVAARIARPNKQVPQLRGLLKVRKRVPTIIAIPTTAGTGSEATVAAVITNSATKDKYAINDLNLIPHYAVLDPSLTAGKPPAVTAMTGMDALTHAVEAYIGRGNTAETKRLSRVAVQLIFDNILIAYHEGNNIEARANMQQAAYYAGVAFTRASVGYIHAVSHTFSGFYGVPHGIANAIIMPHVLRYYGESVQQPLAELADLVGINKLQELVQSYSNLSGKDITSEIIADVYIVGVKTNEVVNEKKLSKEQKAKLMILAISTLNYNMKIPSKITGYQINEADFPTMIERALAEANPLYSVPIILDYRDLEAIIPELYE